MTWRNLSRRLAVVFLAALLAGCGNDDGASVRNVGGGERADEPRELCEFERSAEREAESELHLFVHADSIDVRPLSTAPGVVSVRVEFGAPGEYEVLLVRASAPDVLAPASELASDLAGLMRFPPAWDSCTANFALTAGEYALVVDAEMLGLIWVGSAESSSS